MSTRRNFLKGMGLATAGLALTPGELLAAKKKVQPAAAPKSDKVKIAYIGIGNRGQQTSTSSPRRTWWKSLRSATLTCKASNARRH